MTFSLVGSSVQPVGAVTTYNVNTSLTKNQASSTDGTNIGNLNQESQLITISDAGALATHAISSTFTAQAGVTSLTQEFSSIVDKALTQFQLYDSQGNIIADSEGTAAQQAAFTQWQDGALNISAGTYTAIATPLAGTSEPLSISTQEQQGTSLQVSSSLTGSDPTEYYNFSFSGSNIKLNFNTAAGSNTPHVQLLDSSGNVVADNEGNSFEQSNFQSLTSATGLSAISGNYTVEVSYPSDIVGTTNADGTPDTPTIPYNFQLYSGNSYAVSYNTVATAQPTDDTAAGSVTATSDAQLYSRTQYNEIDASATNSVNIGWIQENQSALDVYSELTAADSSDFYSLTLQQGDNLKFGFNSSTTPDPSNFRVQLYNSTGTQVIADNEGTPAQQAAYKALTTTNGLTAAAGGYLVKVSYAANVANKSDSPYEFNIYSGTSYSSLYKTTASAQTIGNAIASGTYTGVTASGTAIASYLTALSQGDDTTAGTSLLDALKAYV